MLFNDYKVLIKYEKKYELSKKKTSHIMISNN
jgi:hypothetical protein